MNTFNNIAWMGYSCIYPENTMLAFQAAVDAGANAIETDVRLARDGTPVLCLSSSLRDTTDGNGLVSDYSYEELEKQNAAAHILSGTAWDVSFQSDRLEHFGFLPCCPAEIRQNIKFEKIPRLVDLIEFAKDKSIRLYLDIKDVQEKGDRVCNAVCQCIMAHAAAAFCRITLENHNTLALYHQKYPDIAFVAKVMCRMHNPGAYAKAIGAVEMCACPTYVTTYNALANECHEYGIELSTWSAEGATDHAETCKAMIEQGVDGIMTHNPKQLSDLIKEAAR